MYLRTTRRKNKDGSVVEYFELADNVRDAKTGQPVAEIIHNFGRADELNRDDLVRLCRSIARVCGLDVPIPFSPPMEEFAIPGKADIVHAVRRVMGRAR